MTPTGPDAAHWSQGYYCAVAVMLREEGCVTPQVRSVFEQGGGLEHIDPMDRALFVEHGLISTPIQKAGAST